MTKTRWIIVYLIAPILIFPGLFGFWGPEGKSAGLGILKVYLALLAVAFVIAIIITGFK
jgi:hypothetical protein